MAVVVNKNKPYSYLEDEEDALLNEAICCSRNLEIKTDEEDENDEKKIEINEQNSKQEINEENWSTTPWSCMASESDSNPSDLSTSNGSLEIDKSLQDHSNVKEKDSMQSQETQNNKDSKEMKESTDADDTENVSSLRKRMREEENDKDEDGLKISRNRRNSNSSSSTITNCSRKNIEYETDPIVLARRQKDIDYGKNTVGYDTYSQKIPKDQRTKDHPRTPPMHTKYSRRGWDGMVKLWRKQLHFWDPENSENNDKDDSELCQ